MGKLEFLNVSCIQQSAFKNSTLVAIELPNVVEVGANAFEGCASLTGISLPELSTALGASAFKNCTALETVYLGANANTVASTVFAGCTGLRNVTVPSVVCSNATNFKNVFASNSAIQAGITNLTIPSTATSMVATMLGEFKGLTTLTIPFVGLSSAATGNNAVLGKLFTQ